MDTRINTMRHVSVFDPTEHGVPIHIIGCGATGSHTFAALVSLGCQNISVYDYDVVEEHNLANQIYLGRDVGLPKVTGLHKYYCEKLGVDDPPSEMYFYHEKVTPQYLRSPYNGLSKGGIVFLLTDTMESRRAIFDGLTTSHRNGSYNGVDARNRTAASLIIETRMGSTHGNIYTINPYDRASRDAWLSTLVDDNDEDAIELSPCGTALSVGPTAALIANYAVWQMMQFFVDPMALQPRVDLFFKPTLTVTSPAIAA